MCDRYHPLRGALIRPCRSGGRPYRLFMEAIATPAPVAGSLRAQAAEHLSAFVREHGLTATVDGTV